MQLHQSGPYHGSVLCLDAKPDCVSDRLSDFLSTITRALKGQKGAVAGLSNQMSADEAAANLSGSARELADYIARYISMAFNAPYVATCYEPKLGRLHPAKPRHEPLLHMAWRPLNERPMQPCFDLNIGAEELCFSGFVAPKTQEERLALKNVLKAKREVIQERMWEHSLRFLPHADERSWHLWSSARTAWLSSGFKRAPRRFGVMIEGGPVATPVPPGKVSYHVSDNVRRAKAVLDLL